MTINQAFEKNQTNLSSNVVPVGLDFADANDPTMFTMRICRASCKRTSTKQNTIKVHTTTVVAIFIPRSKNMTWHHFIYYLRQ